MGNADHNNIPMEPAGHAGDIDELLLQRYLDGRLDADARADVDELLKKSAAARRTLNAMREEENLIRQALESRIEPSRRIADKVLVALHNEERFRLNALRNRRLRRQVVGVMATAATILLCLWLVKPRDAAGTAVSGTLATVITPDGSARPMNRNTPVYEGDIIVTRQAQFVRLKLANGVRLDIDEHSRVELERGEGTNVRIDSGRMGVDTTAASEDVQVRLAQGSVRVVAGGLSDVWLPRPSGARWPELFDPLSADGSRSELVAEGNSFPAVLTVLKGNAYLYNEKNPEGLTVVASQRSIFTPQARSIRKIDAAGSRVLDFRGEMSWHSAEGVGPRDRVAIGLLEHPDFNELGRRLKLTQKNVPEIPAALSQLQSALAVSSHVQRAEKLAAGQQALRAACELLKEDEIRNIGRMLEGLAHMERGRALLQSRMVDASSAANAAFAAAAVAFEEAQQPVQVPGMPEVKNVKPTWPAALNAGGSTLTVADLSPTDQSGLISSFHHAVAEYWRAKTDTGNTEPGLPASAAAQFAALRADRDDASFEPLGRSIESVAAALGEGLALDLSGDRIRSIETLQDILAVSAAGISEPARRQLDGLKQATLVALVKMHMATGETKKAQTAAEDFALLYPLDANSPAAREIDRTMAGEALKNADKALEQRQFQAAVELYDKLLEESTQEGIRSSAEIRLQRIRALVGAGSADRARTEIEALSRTVPPDRRAEFEAVANDVKALPSAPAKK